MNVETKCSSSTADSTAPITQPPLETTNICYLNFHESKAYRKPPILHFSKSVCTFMMRFMVCLVVCMCVCVRERECVCCDVWTPVPVRYNTGYFCQHTNTRSEQHTHTHKHYTQTSLPFPNNNCPVLNCNCICPGQNAST